MASDKEATLILRIKEAGSAALEKVGSGLKGLATMALAAAAAVGAFATLAIKNFREQELATNQLNQSMVNAGVFTAKLRDEQVKLAESLQKVTTYGDEQIISAMATIQANLKNIPVTKELTKATLDLAAGKGIDLASAAEMVGKTIGTETNALMRQGIAIDVTASKTEKMTQVIDGINAKYKDQAEAAAQGLGSIEQLSNAFSDFMENVGAEIAPTVGAMVKIFTDLFNKLNEGTPLTEAFGNVFKNIAAGALAVKFAVSEVGAAIGITLAAGVEAIQEVMKGNFSKVKDISKRALDQMSEEHIANQEKLYSELDMLDNAHLQQKELNRKLDAQREVASKTAAKENEEVDRTDKFMRQMQEDDYIRSLQGQSYDQQLMLQIGYLDKKIQNETNARTKLTLLKQKQEAQDQLATINYNKREEELNKIRVQNQADTFAKIATLSSSSNSTLATIGKAAGITQIAIDTPVAIGKAMAAFPPPFNFAAAGLVGAAMAAQAARIAGVQLADGGIVKARPGGLQATIGEGGRDEAVIPLEDGKVPGMGGGSTFMINVYGGMLGDPSSAREFAVAVDKELLKLRKSNESLAFDGGLT